MNSPRSPCTLPCVCVCAYICHICFDLMRSFLFCYISSTILFSFLLLPIYLLHPSARMLLSVGRLSLSALVASLSPVCIRPVIIVITEMYKFDHRLDNSASVQAHYRLSMCIGEAPARARTIKSRLASSRAEATVDRDIHNRERTILCACVYTSSSFS